MGVAEVFFVGLFVLFCFVFGVVVVVCLFAILPGLLRFVSLNQCTRHATSTTPAHARSVADADDGVGGASSGSVEGVHCRRCRFSFFPGKGGGAGGGAGSNFH